MNRISSSVTERTSTNTQSMSQLNSTTFSNSGSTPPVTGSTSNPKETKPSDLDVTQQHPESVKHRPSYYMRVKIVFMYGFNDSDCTWSEHSRIYRFKAHYLVAKACRKAIGYCKEFQENRCQATEAFFYDYYHCRLRDDEKLTKIFYGKKKLYIGDKPMFDLRWKRREMEIKLRCESNLNDDQKRAYREWQEKVVNMWLERKRRNGQKVIIKRRKPIEKRE